ncbi:hypothetical protein K1T71_007458 [Dendrolimus kikuchii]|uniref:Uncharacterized protein n=1 Tax=Dendrolimus kikuchii TaxID=765133 RepID=A0ACC1D0F1_9NEOP|nr:hypothetical protein K1T71_007458 [Dendrolimus kikuchii]
MNVYSKNTNIIFKRKLWIIFLLLVVVFIYWCLPVKDIVTDDLFIFRWNPSGQDINCHTRDDGDALPAAEGKYTPKENSIFFHETSCRGGFDSRQACAVESAARLHPTREIHVLFSAPVEERVLKHSCLAKLQTYPNIKLSRVHIARYAKGTPLEAMVNSDQLSKSNWHVEHTSDVLRYLTLYKWGGIYLDTDTLVVKPFDDLGGNWVGREDSTLVNAAVIGIANDKLGRKMIGDVVRELNNTYKPEMWNYNGPGSITRVLRRICKSPKLVDWTAENCQGFPVYGPEYFYPVHYSKFSDYFKAGTVINSPAAYTHHFWNKLSKDIAVKSDSPYAVMAREFCPEIYDMYGDSFGQ